MSTIELITKSGKRKNEAYGDLHNKMWHLTNYMFITYLCK